MTLIEFNQYPSDASVDPAAGYIVFRSGKSWYGVPIRYVVAALTHTPAVRVPGARNGIVGIAHFQGRIITVIDIRPCFGGQVTIDYNSNYALLVVRFGNEEIGILADEIGQVVSISEQEIKPVEEVLGRERSFMQGVARVALEGQASELLENSSESTVVMIDLVKILKELCSRPRKSA